MIQIPKKWIKNKLLLSLLALFLFQAINPVEDSYGLIGIVEDFRSSLQSISDYKDAHENDKVLQEIYVLSDGLYKKLVEFVALYYCKDIIVEAEILYEKILVDISKDVLRLIKVLALYIPILCKNKKISLVEKVRKLTTISCVMALSIAWIHSCYKNKQTKAIE